MKKESDSTIDLLTPPTVQAPLESIINTHELIQRPAREPNYKAETEAMVELAKILLDTPEKILNEIAEITMRLVGADSAGISIAETFEGEEIFRWRGITGQLKPFLNGTMPRYFSPCGIVADTGAHQLMKHMINHYGYVSGLALPLHEVLLVPFSQNGVVIGTLWAVAHTADKKFDQEDLRILTSLSHFAGASVQIAKQRVEKEQAVAQIKLDSQKLSTFFDQAPFPLVMFEGPDHYFKFANAQYQKYFLGKREYLGKKALDVFPQLQLQGFIALLDDVYASGKPFIGNEILFDMEGFNGLKQSFYLNLVYEAMRDHSGKIIGVLAWVLDVTESVLLRQKIENSARELVTEKNKLEAIFQESPAAMALWHGDELIFEKSNPEFDKLYGNRQLIGRALEEAAPELKGQPFIGLIQDVLSTGVTFVGREVAANLVSTPGQPPETRFYDFSYIRINDAEGKPYGVYDHAVDVTDRVMTRRNLEIAKLEAEKANALKSAFLANMSHEIRTPLGAMLGFTDLLRDQGLTATERANYFDILSRNGESLSVIINDILDLSKVEAGHLIVEYLEVRAEEIASDVVSLLGVLAKEKDLVLEYVIDSTTPTSFVSDPTRVRQVLLNLVGNAIKFTQFGSIKIRTYGVKNEMGTNVLCFEVNDTGIGITDTQKESIFEVFVQADGTTTRRFGGTGLGLALSRKLARALGGEVSISRTSHGKGSTFLFTVLDRPAQLSEQFSKTSQNLKDIELPANVLEGVKVLVVDDSPDNQQLIWHYLDSHGAVVEAADDGFKGYRKALAGDFDVILMDIQMPEMDGYTATHKLRKAGYQKPIIALTAHAMSEIRQKCLNVGCTTHLSKPINAKELIATVAEYAKQPLAT